MEKEFQLCLDRAIGSPTCNAASASSPMVSRCIGVNKIWLCTFHVLVIDISAFTYK